MASKERTTTILVFSFNSLEKAWAEAKLYSEREHVTAYIVKRPELFRLFNVKRNGEDLSLMRWTVDTQKDYEFISEIFKKLFNSNNIFYTEDILRVLNENPELLEINSGIQRNEGYQKSIRENGFFSSVRS